MAPPLETPSFAIIDSALCRLNRRGTVVKRLPPLGGLAVLEFQRIGSDLLVREQPGGFLAGMPNLYRVREDFGLVWLAQLPSPLDSYATAVVEPARIVCRSADGHDVALDPHDGALRS